MRISDSISDVCSSDLLLNVLEYRLAEADYLGGSDYSIADMAAWPWVQASWLLDVDLASFPAVSRWSQAIAARQAVIRAARSGRSEERRVGKECVRKCRSRWLPVY